jgi:hypothetical protein|tara:strand:+ start:106 stop:441 length:336 start_codon:yes stop_codon:yes gene_type:complete
MISKVFVIFEDDKTNWWSWLLKKGCRHCYLVKPSPNGYIIHGKRQEGFDLFTVKDQDSIIQDIFAIVDYVPVEKKRSLFMLNTCVGHIKQMLGIDNPFILTPYQLLKHMRK